MVAYFFNFFKLFQKEKKMIKVILCKLSMRTLKCFLNSFFFWPPKVEKTTSKSSILAEIPTFQKFVNYCLFRSQQPKWKNSCSKMWSIEQLYIELGLWPCMKKCLCFLHFFRIQKEIHLQFSDIWHETFQLYQLQNSLDCVTSVTKTAEHYCKYSRKEQIPPFF